MSRKAISKLKISEVAKDYAIDCHRGTNHNYGEGNPYEVHLEMVVSVAEGFIELVPDEERDDVLAGCWVHDCIEDCRQSYNDIKEATNESVAELAYALTNEKGKNRKQRGGDRYYTEMKKVPQAVFIKLCDRIANVEYSRNVKSSMFKMYKKENREFIENLYTPKLDPMFGYLNDVFKDVDN